MIAITKKITGFAVRTPNAQVAVPAPASTPVQASNDPDRRLVLGSLPGIAERSLRFPKRPTDRNGFVAWTSDFIHTPTGKFVVCISSYVNGTRFPFEVWALGAEQPPAASLLCQLLSKILQTDDPGFIRHHLKALKKAVEVPFALTLPHTGECVIANSVGAAIALVYEAHARAVGYLSDDAALEDSPMLAAMSSIREPKSGGAGGYAVFEDVSNPCGHDFPLFIKEAWMEGACQPVPISIWAGSRQVPAESEAILKLASLAMRHRDPQWVGMLLQTLRKHVEVGQELGFARVGSGKPTYYHSTWAYVADLVLNRYQQLGILNEDGRPIAQGSLFAAIEPEPEPAALRPVVTNTMRCPECGETGSLVFTSSCWQCRECSYSKCG